MKRPIRWKLLLWPAGVILLLDVALGIWITTREFEQRQDMVMRIMALCVLSATLLLLWSLVWVAFLSGLRWTLRLSTFAGIAILLLALRFSVGFAGFTGDVVPILKWRWTPDAGSLPLPAVAAVPPGAGAAKMQSPFDFPQFQGPLRDGSVPGVRLSADWSEPPRMLWRQGVGAGWSGFAVAGDFAVTQEQRGDSELVTCYDLTSGELRWSHAEDTRFYEPAGGPGPRATPAIHQGRVYALGATGRLSALDLLGGEVVWSVDIVEDNGASVPTYGVSGSPLVIDERVVVVAGGAAGRSLVAYDAATGNRVWSGGDGRAGYGSVRAAELAGVAQIVVQTKSEIVGHDRQTGAVLWSHAWPGQENTFQPVTLPGDRVFVSGGYGFGGKMFRVRKRANGLDAEPLWESRGLKAKFTNVVFHDGHLFGLDDGILVALDAETGERRWKRGRYGHGQLLLVGDHLLISTEGGDVALVAADPAEYRELGRFNAIDGKTWNHPALAGRYLLLRNDREAACFELPLEG